ncbi:hypothetical protein JTE90_007390 [Oedothorax gibbosus]|uniref:UDENN domain-containing protein n=1 Tax=Oedothorax gibbosus TaxID=931172 RepID=A0AAV6TV56_9ARAC|nr:hypothetical protein JTE90_007390 [Oedothorax gibbosus]
MNDKAVLSSVDEPGSKNKPDFKELCKRFENLSGTEIKEEIPRTPPVPTRRKKSQTEITIKRQDPVLKNSPKYRNSTDSTPKRPISVKERSKLFETTVDVVSGSQSPKFVRQNSKSSDCDNFVPNAIPPAKPPRVFANLENDKPKNSQSTHDANKRSSVQVTSLSKSKNGDSKPRNMSFSFETETIESVFPKAPTLMSAPIIIADEDSSKVKSTSNKTGLRSYLKSTAHNLRDKVKQTKIFVDLTPTTVSPPKHYGTLKRSKSEEHIYAEPCIDRTSPRKKEDTKPVEPLHYMCTTLVKPELPPPRKTSGNVCNRVSVRNMIYSSFASVRTSAKENQNVKAPVLDASDSDVSMKAIEARIIYVKSIRQVSGSSICIAPKLYDALFIINISDGQPEVSHSFPLKVPDAYKYPLLPHICFPDSQLFKAASVYQSETFHFTLYDKGEKVLGYCLRITGWPEKSPGQQPLCLKLPTAICILSRFNAPVFYKKLLNEIEKHLTLPREKCFKYIRSLQKLGVPNAGASISIPDFTECSEEDRVVVSRPLDSHIVSSEITRTLQLLDVNVLVKCVASMLLERRVLLFSSSSSNLYNCCKALSSLLYPFNWPHMFIPVLPSCLTVHCCSELPYVLGLLSNNFNSVLDLLAEHELLIIDVDKGTILKSCSDEDTILPKKIQKALITALNLAKNMTDPTEMLRDTMISEAFVHMFVEIVGHYENHIQDQNENPTFQKEAFLKNAYSYSIQIFLQWFSETQMFDDFVNESLWRTNYRKICQASLRTCFEKRVDEYKWELSHNGEKFSRFIGKTFKNFENFGEMIIHKLKK